MKRIGILSTYKRETIDTINRVAFEYVAAIEKAWAIPYIIPCNVENIRPYIQEMDSFIFPGGGDIDPTLYGEQLTESIDPVLRNDQFLLDFMEKVLEARKPILGICKGMQLVNVLMGGKLCQHIQNSDFHDQYERQYEKTDTAIIEPNSFLHSSFQITEVPINSLHHQAISVLGKELKVVARSKYDGTVEWIEHISLPLYGVQWHPECLEDHGKLFKWFISL